MPDDPTAAAVLAYLNRMPGYPFDPEVDQLWPVGLGWSESVGIGQTVAPGNGVAGGGA